MGRKPAQQLTKKTVLEALRLNCGIQSRAAEALGVERHCITRFLKRHPEMAPDIEAAREEMVDLAESALLRNVRNGQQASIIFVLKCLGKSRGWVDVQVIDASMRSPDRAEKMAEALGLTPKRSKDAPPPEGS